MTDPKPFGQLSDAEKGALLLAHHEGKRIEVFIDVRKRWGSIERPRWCDWDAYRIAPEPKTPDSIDWGHVAGHINAIARDWYDDVYTFADRPSKEATCWAGTVNGLATNFASYRRGTCDWQDSLLIRPGYEGKA